MAKSQLVAVTVATNDQSLAPQCLQHLLDIAATGERLELAQLEPPPDDAGRLKHALLTVGQAVESRRKHGVDARRHADLLDRSHCTPRRAFVDQASFIDQHLNELFAEKWSAGGPLDDLVAQLGGNCLDLEQAREEGSCVLRAQWIKGDSGRVG